MINPKILLSTWCDGLFIIAGENRLQELAGQAIKALAPDVGEFLPSSTDICFAAVHLKVNGVRY